MIHVCYGLHDSDGRYSKFTGTSILSMFKNLTTPANSVTVHILHDNTLTDDNRDKFLSIAESYGQLVKFYNVETICPEEVAVFQEVLSNAEKKSFSIASTYIFMALTIFSGELKKFIYLDADTIVNLDISELWQIPLDDKALAAVPESVNGVAEHLLCADRIVDAEDYFSTGVMILDLEKLLGRDYEKLLAGLQFVTDNPKYECFSQNVFNCGFSKDFLHLPQKFNVSVRDARERNDTKVESRIYHYPGKALNLHSNDEYNRLWCSYFVKTPWFNKYVISHIEEGVRILNAEQRKFDIQITKLMATKRRAFFFNASQSKKLAEIFGVRASEEVIVAYSKESIRRLIESMSSEKVFFIVVDSYPALSKILNKAGFVEGRDFLDGRALLSEDNGFPLDTNFLVKAL